MDAASLAGGAARRANGYFLVSRLLSEPPSTGLLRDLAVALAPAAQAEGALAELHRIATASADDAQQVQDLAVEFTRILGGLSERNGAPPI